MKKQLDITLSDKRTLMWFCANQQLYFANLFECCLRFIYYLYQKRLYQEAFCSDHLLIADICAVAEMSATEVPVSRKCLHKTHKIRGKDRNYAHSLLERWKNKSTDLLTQKSPWWRPTSGITLSIKNGIIPVVKYFCFKINKAYNYALLKRDCRDRNCAKVVVI